MSQYFEKNQQLIKSLSSRKYWNQTKKIADEKLENLKKECEDSEE